jgi:ribosomal protein S18 acetylase RimI-like enzyme
MLNIEIRKATEADLAAIIDLYAQPDMDNHNVLSLDQAKKVFKKFSAYPCYHIYVAVDGDKVVGTFALLIMDNLAHQGTPSGIIEDVTVHPDCQSQGVGKRMMEYAMRLSSMSRWGVASMGLVFWWGAITRHCQRQRSNDVAISLIQSYKS